MKDSAFYYSVGALLYCPANKTTIADAVIKERFPKPYSLALCLEDTIRDDRVEEAEQILAESLRAINAAKLSFFYLPKIFIRVRSAKQINYLSHILGESAGILTGFILPKFSLENADLYIETIQAVNQELSRHFYIMPIMESPSIIPFTDRYQVLYTLKEKLDRIEELVLNIRIGGNDLCHCFGFRRNHNQSIHDIKPISHILSDIVTVFGMDYIVSGPVWEYYRGENWEQGLSHELKEDRLCGLIGKTVIHPNQIPSVNAAYRVSQKEVNDALAILNWKPELPSLVSGSVSGERMNEYKTHSNWAKKILFLSENFGIEQ